MQSLNHPKQHTKSPRVSYLLFLAQRYDTKSVTDVENRFSHLFII